MDRAALIERVGRVDAVCADPAAAADSVTEALVAVREIVGWAESRKAKLVARLEDVSSFPESAIADADRCSLGAATRTKERSETLAATPNLADALGDGAITAGHIDAVTRTTKQLDAEQREELLEKADELAALAAHASVDEFRRRLELEAKRLQRDDGMDRLERQRRATRLRTWVDNDGMWNLRGRFDPVTGVKLASTLDTAVDTLFAEATPDTCPTDPIERHHHLRALALARLLDGGMSTKPGRPEFLVVIDADAPNQPGPVVEWPIPVEIPTRVLAALIGDDTDADVHTVVVRNGIVLHAPGELNLGRTSRLANRAQRRALRSLYTTCAIPGCTVTFTNCKLHHVIWWRHGGRTDLSNLLPVCAHHHTKIHHDHWTIELDPDRHLTLRLPDGTIRTTGPPSIRAA
jgi:hypothetical protein